MSRRRSSSSVFIIITIVVINKHNTQSDEKTEIDSRFMIVNGYDYEPRPRTAERALDVNTFIKNKPAVRLRVTRRRHFRERKINEKRRY